MPVSFLSNEQRENYGRYSVALSPLDLARYFHLDTTWLVTHKVLLPGCSTLERYIASLRSRVENRLWRSLGRDISSEQQARLENLLVIPEGNRNSLLDRLRTGPVRISGPSLVQALLRLHSVRELAAILIMAPMA